MKAVMPTETLADNFGIEKAINMIADAGFEGVDFSDFSSESFVNFDGYIKKAKEVRKLAESRGLTFSQSHGPMVRSLLKAGNWDYAVERTKRSIEVTSLLGAEAIVIHPFQKGFSISGSQELYEINMDFFRKLIPCCEDYNVKLAIENMVWVDANEKKCDGICGDPDEFIYYIDSLKSDFATGCLDFGHLTLCGREPQDVIRYLGGDKITCLHVHDNDYISDRHTLPCTMNMNWGEICKALADIEYGGDFTLEASCFVERFDESFLPTVLKYMADLSKYLIKKIQLYKI